MDTECLDELMEYGPWQLWFNEAEKEYIIPGYPSEFNYWVIENQDGDRLAIQQTYFWALFEHGFICLAPGGVNPSTYLETLAN